MKLKPQLFWHNCGRNYLRSILTNSKAYLSSLSSWQYRGAVFLLARIAERAVGCGAFRPLWAGEAEVKRMFVLPEARGLGVGREILQQLESAAGEMGYTSLRLETGLRQPEAIGLYESAGYRRVPCYGPYADNPMSVCFEKLLAEKK
ncbi:MAG: GNAT family N-acetyltransferase [Pyrinomonadaceae bacterium]